MTRLQLPVRLLRHADGKHRLCALFAPDCFGEGPSIHDAANRLRALLRPLIERGEVDVLRLSPGVPITQRSVEVRADADIVELCTGSFSLESLDFLVLPGLGGAVLAFPTGQDPAMRAEQLERGVRGVFRAARKRGEELVPEKLEPGERLTEIELRVAVPNPALSLEPSMLAALFGASFGAEPAFVGSREIAKVATPLNDLFPDRLQRTYVEDARVADVGHALFTSPHRPLAIVGPAGSGRTTLVHEALAVRLTAAGASWDLDGSGQPRVWHLDPGRIVAGMSVVGQWNRRLEAVLQFAESRSDAFFCDRPLALTVIGKYSGSELSVATVLRGWLQDRRLAFVVECTAEEWTRLEERDRPFAGLFSVLRVDEPTPERALRMVVAGAVALSERKAVSITPAALRRLVELDRRHPGTRVWPGRLLDRLDRLATRGARVIDDKVITEAFQADLGLRPEIFAPNARYAEPDVRAFLAERLIGQGAAVEALVEVVLTLKTGLVRPDKPVATLFFAGPTGVGKTEAAKALAECLFCRDGLVRLDMNELGDSGAVERLLGTVHTSGMLAERLRNRPYAVLLLDEIEKAHPSVHDLLLGVLDEGRVTDGAGRRLDLRGVVIILTSNVGASEIGSGRGFVRTPGSIEGTFRGAVERHFRPEFVNRLDRIVAFSALSAPEVRRIADLIVRKVLTREGFARRTVLLDVPTELVDRLAEEGTDPTLGARALKRVIEQRLIGPVAAELASVSPDLPVLILARLEGGRVRFDVRALPWAPARAPHRITTHDEAEACIEQVRRVLNEQSSSDLLRAVIGPGGVHIVERREAALLEWLGEPLDQEEAFERRSSEAPRTAVPPRARVEDRGRFLRQTWHSTLSLREGLLEMWPDAKVATSPRHLQQRTRRANLASRLLQASQSPCSFRILGEPLTRGSVVKAFTPWVEALNKGFLGMPFEATKDGPLSWSLRGGAPLSMWRHEAGIQLFLPVSGPADALRVRVVPDEGGEPPSLDQVIRNWVAPSPDHPRGLVHDVRSGEMADSFQEEWLLLDEP